ncbi:MAG: hypothetical protein JMDDDDMK_03813 [Acidobacteria bacterium]|nr:hypothetical protein [Acidobacteriota bacterium]
MSLELRAVEIHFAQIARAVPFRLIVEVARRRVAALAAGAHGFGAHRLAEFDDGHEAVAAGSVPFLRPLVRTRAERGQRSPHGGRKAHRNARPGVAERMRDVGAQPLKAIDLAPRRFPASEVSREFVRRRRERLQQLFSRRFAGDVIRRCQAPASHSALNVFGPEHGERSRNGRHRPAQIPRAQQRNLFRRFRLERIGRGRLVPRFDQRGNRFLEPGQITVVSRRDQRIEREIFFALQHSDRVMPARRFNARINIGRIIALLPAARARRLPRPVVGVVEPAARRIQQVRRLVHRQQAAPIGRRIAAIHRLCPIEFGIALRNKVAVKISDGAVGVGVDRVVR